MSVERPRLAAAQRTAARKRPVRRWARLASWLLIGPTLAVFSFSIIASATNYGKLDYARTVKELGTSKPLVILKSNGRPMMCSVTATQAASISKRWHSWWTTMTFDGHSLRTLAVEDAKEPDLRSMIGPVSCQLVREKSIFYLPFNANLS